MRQTLAGVATIATKQSDPAPAGVMLQASHKSRQERGKSMKSNMDVARALGLGKCSNCGGHLTVGNIAAALVDVGIDPNEEETMQGCEEIDHLTFCCPTYTDDGGCLGYSSEDREQAAYWYRR